MIFITLQVHRTKKHGFPSVAVFCKCLICENLYIDFCINLLVFQEKNIWGLLPVPLAPRAYFPLCKQRKVCKGKLPHGIFLRWPSFWGTSGKMISVMHSAPKLRGFTLTRHPCLGSAAAILASVHITYIKAHPQKIPKGKTRKPLIPQRTFSTLPQCGTVSLRGNQALTGLSLLDHLGQIFK